MIGSCAAFDPAGRYIAGLIGYADCRVAALAEDGYLGVGTAFSRLLTGVLTIYVAVIGYRMVFGEAPTVRGGLLAAIKVGFVLALATQWPTYQALVYSVAIVGPEEVAAAALGDEPGGRGALASRFQSAYERIDGVRAAVAAAVVAGTVRAAPRPLAPATPDDTLSDAPTADSGNGPSSVSLPPTFAEIALRGSALTILIAPLVGMISVRLVAGLFLAIGPLFLMTALFDATRGLLEGWVRVLGGTALGSVAVAATLTLELGILEPQIAALVRVGRIGAALSPVPGEIFATTSLFALLLLAVLIACGRTAAGFRLSDASPQVSIRTVGDNAGRSAPPETFGAVAARAEPLGRATSLADAVDALQRRDGPTIERAEAAGPRRSSALPRIATAGMLAAAAPLGQRARRTAERRRSATAARRDARG